MLRPLHRPTGASSRSGLRLTLGPLRIDVQGADPGVLRWLAEFLEPLGVPVVFDLPFGHGERNLCWPFGGLAAIDGDRGEVELLESAVAGG